MGYDMCSACGEEHDSPRGAKCKRTRLNKKSTKCERVEQSEELTDASGDAVQEGRRTGSPGGSGPSAAKESARRKVAIVEDDEERELRERLEHRARERRKKALRAALEASTDSGEEEAATGRERRAKKKKARAKKHSTRDGASGSGDDSSSPSTSPSSSSSSGRSRSRTRRRRKKRSKFALDKMTKGEKKVKRLTVMELLYAALIWGIKRSSKVSMDMDNLKGYMGHLAYMCMHAITGTYTDEAYRGYDKAVRDKVKEKGLKWFKMGDQELSILHFNLDNARSMKDTRKTGKRASSSSSKPAAIGTKVKGACYAFNYTKGGCVTKDCEWEHKCIVCKSWDHSVETCSKKRY